MVKTIIGLVTSVGVSQVVGNLIDATTPANLGKIKKLTTFVGGAVVSAILSMAASNYMEEQVDGVVKTLKSISKKEEKEKE